MEVGKAIKLEIEGYDMNGLGVAHVDGKIIFVSKALKDEIVLAEITSVHKKFCFAKTLKVILPSVNRILSPCSYDEGCGVVIYYICDMM